MNKHLQRFKMLNWLKLPVNPFHCIDSVLHVDKYQKMQKIIFFTLFDNQYISDDLLNCNLCEIYEIYVIYMKLLKPWILYKFTICPSYFFLIKSS